MLHSVCYFVIYSVNSIYEDKQIGGISPQTKRVFLKIKDDCYQKDFFLYLKSINDIVSVSTNKKISSHKQNDNLKKNHRFQQQKTTIINLALAKLLITFFNF